MDIKPIETYYNGYRFRSRLEARWAVFFDAAGIEYQYEPEGFNINGICYLPDFYLPNNDRWIEVKGKELSSEELKKCSAFCKAKDHEGIAFNIFLGQPLDVLTYVKIDELNNSIEITSEINDATFLAIVCFSYQRKTPGRLFFKGNNYEDIKKDIFSNDTIITNNAWLARYSANRFIPSLWTNLKVKKEKFYSAALKARQARFEHGERG